MCQEDQGGKAEVIRTCEEEGRRACVKKIREERLK